MRVDARSLCLLTFGRKNEYTRTKSGNNRAGFCQFHDICRLVTSSTYPVVGNRVIGGTSGTVKQAAALGGNDPAGGNIARGTVLEVNGTTDCTILLN